MKMTERLLLVVLYQPIKAAMVVVLLSDYKKHYITVGIVQKPVEVHVNDVAFVHRSKYSENRLSDYFETLVLVKDNIQTVNLKGNYGLFVFSNKIIEKAYLTVELFSFCRMQQSE